MSKSKGNLVDPNDMVAHYGSDTTRMYVLFAAPPEKDLEWNAAGVEGIYRFVGRVFRFLSKHAAGFQGLPASGTADANLSEDERKVLRKLHQTIRCITADFEGRWHFNTDIAALMELTNMLYSVEGKVSPPVMREVLEGMSKLLAPFAPYLAHQLWQELGHEEDLMEVEWPGFDPLLAKEEEREIPVQINGRLRSKILVCEDMPTEDLQEAALADARIAQMLAGQQVVKIIVIPNKLVNIVVSGREK
jgi:leucyl-tRNA synthetase